MLAVQEFLQIARQFMSSSKEKKPHTLLSVVSVSPMHRSMEGFCKN